MMSVTVASQTTWLSLAGLTGGMLLLIGAVGCRNAEQDNAQRQAAAPVNSADARTGSPVAADSHRAEAGAGSGKRFTDKQESPPNIAVDPLTHILARRDAAKDGWETEVLSELAGSQLTKLGKLLNHATELSVDELRLLAAESVAVVPLRPEPLEATYSSESLNVLSVGDAPQEAPRSTMQSEGPAALRDALIALAAPFAGSDRVHTKFKIIRVNVQGDSVETEAFFQADGVGDHGIVQQNATWTCQWKQEKSPAADKHPLLKLTSISVGDFSESVGSTDSEPLFLDCTESVLGANASFGDQLMKSTNHWRQTLQKSLGIDVFGHQGLAIGDANGDGLDDIYVCQPGGIPNRLYVQLADGTARDESGRSELDLFDRSRSALFLDLDSDGDQDLVLITNSMAAFFANDGTGRFALKTKQRVGTATTLSAADYDNDGDLDLYVCGYSAPSGGESAPVPYHDANNGHRNRLLRNDGEWQFTDVTGRLGLDSDNTRYTLSACWEDFDNDGDMDLYVANDFGRNCLYRNDDGQFVNIAPAAGVEDISAGMGVSWGDYNNDGLMDIYVSNMFSSAGNRVAYQRRFRDSDNSETRSHFQRHARGNSLFENVGDGTFRDVSVDAAVTMGRWSWSSLFADINNDGRLDLLVSNGLATNEETVDL